MSRRPVLPATVGPGAAMALQAILGDEHGRQRLEAYRQVFASADPQAGRELERAQAEIAEAARQWAEWHRAGACAPASVSAVAAQAGASSVSQELTTSQVAQRLEVSPQRVRQLVTEGRLVAHKRGGSWLVELAALEAYVRMQSER